LPTPVPQPRHLIALMAALAILVSACSLVSGAPSAAPTAVPTPSPVAIFSPGPGEATPGQTGRIVLAPSHFAITLPTGWQSLPVDPVKMKAYIESLPADSDIRAVLEKATAASTAAKFTAFDVRPGDVANGFARNVNIIVQPAARGVSLTDVEAAGKASLATLSSVRKPIKSKIVGLPSGQAVRVDYTIDVPGADGKKIAVAGIQYYLLLKKATLIITFSSDLDTKDAADADFSNMIRSIEAIS
jgi:hypothetical protein